MFVENKNPIYVLFQAKYCYLLSFPCPTKEKFDSFDTNQDGILTWSEWESKVGAQ